MPVSATGQRSGSWSSPAHAEGRNSRSSTCAITRYRSSTNWASPAYVPPKNEVAQRFAEKVAEFDGYIVITAEYNHGIPAVLKNALDHVYAQFHRKPVAFVGYGGVGGARAIEQLRLVAVELQAAPLRNAVHIGMTEFLGLWQQGKAFSDYPHLEQSAGVMLDDLLWWAKALRAARDGNAGEETQAAAA